MTEKEKLAIMLADALQMEKQTIEILEQRADRIRNHPVVVERFKKHIKETSWQIAQLENSLKQLSPETPPSDGLTIGDIAVLLASGDVIQNSIANSAFERFEMAVYKRLSEAATTAEEHEVARICDTIMRQEEAMAEWLEENLGQTPLVYLMFDEITTPAVSEESNLPKVAAGPLTH